jgi:septum formation protein
MSTASSAPPRPEHSADHSTDRPADRAANYSTGNPSERPTRDPASPASPFHFAYLASQSPRRQELLNQLGIGFELLLPDADEDAEALEAELPGEPARLYVERVCLAKAEAAARRLMRTGRNPAPILVADTTVALDAAILGKPSDAAHAIEMLTRLSGRSHEVMTAVAVVPAPGVNGYPSSFDASAIARTLSISTVRFAALTREQIERYAASGEPLGKAGAYGIQGRAAEFIAHIEGSYSGIMGLPLFETAALLRTAGVAF